MMNYLCPLPGALRKCGLARVFEAVRLFSAKLRHFLWSAKKSGEKVRDGVEDLAPTGYYSNVEKITSTILPLASNILFSHLPFRLFSNLFSVTMLALLLRISSKIAQKCRCKIAELILS
ncbi:MAG: hypothetical protein UDM12_00485, partial [Prevotellamassilia sp.]|nr:hypothetical protein [Prevotellamassilia sp.]